VQSFRAGGSVPSQEEISQEEIRAARAARASANLFAFLLPPQPLPFPRPHFNAGVISLAATVSIACLLPIFLRGKADHATSFFLVSSLSIPAVILGVGGTALWKGTLRKWWEYREEWVICSGLFSTSRRRLLIRAAWARSSRVSQSQVPTVTDRRSMRKRPRLARRGLRRSVLTLPMRRELHRAL
jgi:hypothetical protein